MEVSKRSRLTHDAVHQLQEGISIVFSRWVEIQDAVNFGFGGPYSREIAVKFESYVFYFFVQPTKKRKATLYIDDLEDLLIKNLNSLCVIPCRTIVEEVAELLMEMYEECLEGNYQSIQKLRESAVPNDIQPIKVVNDEDVDDHEDVDDLGEDESPNMMMIDNFPNQEVAPQSMEVDDGWITVTRSKKKGKGLKK
ncbi:unnamed protein product [Amaranthus hypochondriacus]